MGVPRAQSLPGILLISVILWQTSSAARPHILFFQVSDLGMKDVGWNSDGEFETPIIDALRESGVELVNFYAHPSAMATRIAVATAKYPYKIGYANSVGNAGTNTNHSLSLEHKIMPQYLKDEGYSTHLIGNWVHGACSQNHAPWNRGFDSFYGSMGAFVDHYTHTNKEGYYDFWLNNQLNHTANGSYSTELLAQRAVDVINDHYNDGEDAPLFIYMALEALHKPLQAPDKYLDRCTNDDEQRRMRCAMMAAVDDGLGRVMDAMNETGYIDKLAVFFVGLNSGPGKFGSSSYPLRGRKGKIYEGGVRVPAFVYSKTLLSDEKHTFNGQVHAVDLLPTMMTIADRNKIFPADFDGRAVWAKIRNAHSQTGKHFDLILDIDVDGGIGAIRRHDMKLVHHRDFADGCAGWWNYDGRSKATTCKEWELYNVTSDVSEYDDLSEQESHKRWFNKLMKKYDRYKEDYADPVVNVEIENDFLKLSEDVFVPSQC